MRTDDARTSDPTCCLQPSIEDPAGTLLVPTSWTDPLTGEPVPVDARCGDCGELYGNHRLLACCIEICGRCGEPVARCGCRVD